MELLNRIRSCAICQSFVPPIKWLCPYCRSCIEGACLPPKDVDRREGVFTHLRLFDWREDNDALIRPFLMSLKRVHAPSIFKELAWICFSRFAHLSFWPRDRRAVFVPAPPSLEGRPDHALQLAEALAGLFAGDVAAVLKRETKDAQKGKSRLQRSKIRFSLSSAAADSTLLSATGGAEKSPLVVFTDDVLTTGWTARKAFHALGQPKRFLICTLAFRRQAEKAAVPFQPFQTRLLYLKDSLRALMARRFLALKRKAKGLYFQRPRARGTRARPPRA